MAKKKIGNGAGAQDTEEMTKGELKAYHKSICDFYEEHGWRTTLSHFSLSPAQAKDITAKVRARAEKAKEKEKAAKKKAKAAKKKAPKATKKKAPKKAPKKVKETSKKAPKAKKEKAPKKVKAAKKPGPKKGSRKKTVVSADGLEGVLDYLLAYRNKKGEAVSLDTAIADITTQVRAA